MNQIVAIAISARSCGTPQTSTLSSAARFRADLNPLQRVRIDTPENKSIELQCGDNAESLAIVDAKKLAAVGEAK